MEKKNFRSMHKNLSLNGHSLGSGSSSPSSGGVGGCSVIKILYDFSYISNVK